MGNSSSEGARKFAPGNAVLRERDERLEALKSTIGRLAHDFNNMLAPMIGYIALIREETGAEGLAGQYAEAMESSARSAEGHLESVLLAVRPNRKFTPHEFNFGGLIRYEMEQWKGTLPQELNLEIIERIEDCTAMADEQQWGRAIQQLLSNARYALALGGRLEVWLTEERLSGEELQELGVWEQEVCKLVIRDSGFGMREEVARRAFEPFFTTRTQARAAGLGLAVVHSVVQVHGGQVMLQSAVDQGTCVTIWLPKRRSQGADASGARKSSQKRRKALLIEGDLAAREVLREWLQGEGLEVHTAAGDTESRRVFDFYRNEWGLIVSDVSSDSISAGLLQSILGDGLGRKCILLNGGLSGGEPGIGPGEHLLLRKPFSRGAFTEAVREQLGGSERD